MTAKTLAASVIAVLAITACGTTTRQSSSVGSSPTVAWASCMRYHGVTGFPDPIAGHTISSPTAPGRSSLALARIFAAEQVCNGHEHNRIDSVMDALIDLEDLNKRYAAGGPAALDGVDLQVRNGK